MIECRNCGQSLFETRSTCWRCGFPVARTLQARRPVGSPFLLVAALAATLTAGYLAVALLLAAPSPPAAAAPSPSPPPAHATTPTAEATPRGADAPGTYTVQRGDSLFEIAATFGVSAEELVYWNEAEFPSLVSTPAVSPGWVLRVAGPPLPTPIATAEPRATPPPAPTPHPVALVPGAPPLVTFDAAFFGPNVTVTHYEVTGLRPSDIVASMEVNGPFSEWLQGNVVAHVEPQFEWGIAALPGLDGSCRVIGTREPAVTAGYTVLLPAWTPPPGTGISTVEWWNAEVTATAIHERTHVEIFERYLGPMNAIVSAGTECTAAATQLEELVHAAIEENCRFDLEEYGASLGLALESCIEG